METLYCALTALMQRINRWYSEGFIFPWNVALKRKFDVVSKCTCVEISAYLQSLYSLPTRLIHPSTQGRSHLLFVLEGMIGLKHKTFVMSPVLNCLQDHDSNVENSLLKVGFIYFILAMDQSSNYLKRALNHWGLFYFVKLNS